MNEFRPTLEKTVKLEPNTRNDNHIPLYHLPASNSALLGSPLPSSTHMTTRATFLLLFVMNFLHMNTGCYSVSWPFQPLIRDESR